MLFKNYHMEDTDKLTPVLVTCPFVSYTKKVRCVQRERKLSCTRKYKVAILKEPLLTWANLMLYAETNSFSNTALKI